MSVNTDAFYALDPAKREAFLKAALTEFAEKGFARASTNAITKKANVSKGSLFYYFGSKQELFDFLCEYSISFANDTYVSRFNPQSGDFLERYLLVMKLKQEAIANLGEIINFYETAFTINEKYFAKHKEQIEKVRKAINDRLFKDIDYSLFRDDIEPKHSIEYIITLTNAFEKKIENEIRMHEISMSKETAVADLWSRFYEFIEDMRRAFYKPIISQ